MDKKIIEELKDEAENYQAVIDSRYNTATTLYHYLDPKGLSYYRAEVDGEIDTLKYLKRKFGRLSYLIQNLKEE